MSSPDASTRCPPPSSTGSSPAQGSAPHSGRCSAAAASASTWIPATAVGLGAGLAAGAALVSYRTDITSLALMGAVSGLGRRHRPRRDARQRQAHARLERRHRRAVGPRMDRHHRRRHRRQPAVGRLRRLRVPHPRLPAEHVHRSVRSGEGGHVMTAGTHVVFGTGPAGRAVATCPRRPGRPSSHGQPQRHCGDRRRRDHRR